MVMKSERGKKEQREAQNLGGRGRARTRWRIDRNPLLATVTDAKRRWFGVGACKGQKFRSTQRPDKIFIPRPFEVKYLY